MGSNKQPKDRQTALTSHLQRMYAAMTEGKTLYHAHALRVYVSDSKEGKIQGIKSINVTPDMDCLIRWIEQKEGIVCSHCYAIGALMTYRQSMIRRLMQNAILMDEPLAERKYALPRDLTGAVRINAFGEVMGKNHAEWILAICKANPKATFSLITKRAHLFPMQRRPKNLILISSTMRIGDMGISARTDKTYAVVHEVTEEMMRDPTNYPCQNHCMTCFIHGEGCYSKKGPKRIVRILQK